MIPNPTLSLLYICLRWVNGIAEHESGISTELDQVNKLNPDKVKGSIGKLVPEVSKGIANSHTNLAMYRAHIWRLSSRGVLHSRQRQREEEKNLLSCAPHFWSALPMDICLMTFQCLVTINQALIICNVFMFL